MYTRIPLTRAVLTLVCSATLISASQGAVVNLTTFSDTTTNNEAISTASIYDTTNATTSTQTAGVVNGAYFVGGSSSAGAGSSRALYRVEARGEESGYNRPDVFDSSVLGGDTHIITKSDLVTTDDGNYYIFSLDLNEGGTGLISLDEFRIYTGAADPAPLPSDEASLGDLGTLRYHMNGSEENHILLEAGVSGSDTSDLYVFIPVVSLAGAAASDQVYVYTAFGEFQYDGAPANSSTWSSGSGNEEWSIPNDANQQPQFVPPAPIPEPSSLALIAGASIGFILRRKR